MVMSNSTPTPTSEGSNGMIEAMVLHRSLIDRDGVWHSIGRMICPIAWATRAAREYERPVKLITNGEEVIYEPPMKPRESGQGVASDMTSEILPLNPLNQLEKA